MAVITFERWYDVTNADYGFTVAQTLDGGYIITGYTISILLYDMILIRTDSLGKIVWSSTYGGEHPDCGYSVLQTSDGFTIIGSTRSYGAGETDVYLVKTDFLGDTIWTKTFGGTDNDRGLSIIQTSDGGYLIAGETWSYGAGSCDVYLIRANSSGDTLWTKTYGGYLNDGACCVIESADSCYLIAGYALSFTAGDADMYLIKTDSNGDTIWTKTYGGSKDDQIGTVYETSDKGFIIEGYTKSFGAGGTDIYLVKVDSIGDTIWTKTYGGALAEWGGTVIQSSSGGYSISASTESFGAGGWDIYLIKTNSIGDTIWTRTYGGNQFDRGGAMVQTLDGGIVITGVTGSFGADTADVYLIKTDSLGNVSGLQEQLDQRHETRDLKLTCFPNPFSQKTIIQLTVNSSQFIDKNRQLPTGNCQLQIYDVSGRMIKHFSLPTAYSLLPTVVTWDGRNDYGEKIHSGIYVIKINEGEYEETEQLLLLK